MNEQLIGVAVLATVFATAIISFVGYIKLSNWFLGVKSKRRSQAWQTNMVCRCPGCRADIFHRVKDIMESDLASSNVLVQCSECETRSIWLPFATPPGLARYMLPNTNRWVEAGSARSNRASQSM